MKRLAVAMLAFLVMFGAARAQTVDLGALIPSGGASATGRVILMSIFK